MNSTGKPKILLLIIGILLLANIAMLVYFLNGKENRRDGKKGREGMLRSFLKNEVGFTDPQLIQYDSLSKSHREKMKAAFEAGKSAKEKLYKDLGSLAFGDSAIAATVKASAEMQQQMEIKMFAHFSEVRKLATPQQLTRFDTSFYKILSRRGDGKKRAEEKK